MRKVRCACLVLLILCMTYACANAQQQKKSSIVTYYPAPRVDYKTVRLDPSNEPASGSPGQMYYNSSPTTDRIMYYNLSNKWVPLGGGSGTDETTHINGKDAPPATKIGDAYFDNVTDMIRYRNKTGEWVNMAADQYWSESDLIPASGSNPAHYNVYLANDTIRRVGIGTNAPTAPLDVRLNDTAGASEQVRMASFSTHFDNKNTDQWLSFYMFPYGTTKFNSYLNTTSMIFASGNPAENLKLAALSASGSVSFNVGGYDSPNSEVMRLTNPGGESNPSPRVGIGNSTPPFALFIDSKINTTSVFAVRQVATQQSANWYKGGYWNLFPVCDILYVGYGLFYKHGFGFYCDLFKLPTGVKNSAGAKIGISRQGLALTTVGAYNAVSGLVSSWALDDKILFDRMGAFKGTVSSRAKKENFIPLDQDEILQKIDQLEVSRWNYISQGPSVTRIGPVAEDFYRLFKTGQSDKNLQPMDSAGVSLAGVKALSGKINAQQQQLQELQAEIKDIRSQMGLRRGGLR